MLAPALGRRLKAAASALHRRERTAIEIVDVAAHLQLAGAVDEGGLIGEVHPDRRRLQLQVLLGAAEHPRDPRRRPVLLGVDDVEENLGIFCRILHAHAAVAVGAHLVGEVILVRGVVLIDQEAVGEVEPNPSQCIPRAGRLRDRDATAAVAHAQPHAGEYGGILCQRRQILVMHDRRRHVPGRVDGDEFHRLAQQRRRHAGLADDDAGGPHLRAVMHHPEREVRLIDDHVRGAKVARIPPPALHVGEDRLDLPRAIAFLGACGAAQFREHRLELAILFVLRAEGVEHLARILRRCDGVEDVRRLGRRAHVSDSSLKIRR